MATVARMEVMHGPGKMTSSHHGWPNYSHYWMPSLLQRLTLSTSYVTIPQREQPVTWWQVGHCKLPHPVRGNNLFSFQRTTTLNMDFPLLTAMLPSTPPSMDLIMPYSPSWYSIHPYFCSLELTFWQMEGRTGPRLVKLTGLTMFPTILKQQVDWPFEDSLIASGRWQHLGEVGKLPPGCSMSFTSAVSPVPQIQASRNEGLEMSYSDSWWSTFLHL